MARVTKLVEPETLATRLCELLGIGEQEALVKAARISEILTDAKSVNDEPLVPTSKVAEFLSIAEQTLINWRSAETGPPYHKLGRTIRYRLSEVAEWAEAQKHLASA